MVVNYPDKPVALILGAYDPTAWNISWTPGTKIAAVMVTGHHSAVIAGIDKSTATINSNDGNHNTCSSGYQPGEWLTGLAKSLFGKGVTSSYQYDEQGTVSIGIPFKRSAVSLISAKDNAIELYIGKNLPKDGQAGLDEAERMSVLRKITAADLDGWDNAVAKRKGQATPQRPGTQQQRTVPDRTYMILKPFVFPAGLYGGHSATFYLAKGVPRPIGDAGHSSLGDFNQFP